ncbi:MAG: hypothetical protein AB7N73_07500 [Gemmatimonadales bacterium]
MIGHPHEAALLRFLDGSGADVERKRVAHHLADCQRCRDLVQGHRRVRQALVSAATSAPPALLDRVLATRATGEGVILPVDVESGRRREWRIPFSTRRVALGVLAASAVLAVGVMVVELLPRLPIAAAREETAWAFERLIEALGNPRPGGPQLPRPDAPPAVIHPERMREFTAVYETRHFVGPTLVAVDTSPLWTVRRNGPNWNVRSVVSSRRRSENPEDSLLFYHSETLQRSLTTLDQRSLRPLASTTTVFQYHGRGSEQSRLGRVDTREVIRLNNTLKRERTNSVQFYTPDGSAYAHTDSAYWGLLPTLRAPEVLGYFRDRDLLLLLVDMGRWWAGSFSRQVELRGRPGRGMEERLISSRVVGRRRLDLPIGKTDVWKVEHWLSDYPLEDRDTYYRVSDGLLAAEVYGEKWKESNTSYTELRLLSVTYP